MHFVIGVFISAICLITGILFLEVFPKWFKVILTFIGSLSAGYALAILIRKISIWTNAYATPILFPTSGICAAVVLIITIIVILMLKKKTVK